MATGNTTYGTDGFLSLTMKHYIPKVVDNAFDAFVLLWILKTNGRIESKTGAKIVQPLLYSGINAVGSFGASDTFAAPVAQGVTAAEFDWKRHYAAISFDGLELDLNAGKEQVVSLLQTRMDQAEMSIGESMNSMLFADGTGNSSKDFDGLDKLVGSATNTVGGIDRNDAGNVWWRPHIDAAAANVGLAKLYTLYNTVTYGADKPTNVITTQAGFEAYEALLDDNVRYEDVETANAGFTNLKLKQAPVVFDRDCQADRVYMLNIKYITLVRSPRHWFTPTDWLVPVNQDVKYKNLISYGNLVLSNSRRQAVATSVTDA